MKAPKKVITAMAMAALLGGTAVPAFAAGNPVGFTTTTGVNGQDPLQTSKQYQKDKANLEEAIGDIQVNGEFTRTINNFPTETEEGHYLQVTMPISLNYTYNLDKETLTSAKGKITNESVSLTKGDDGTKKQPAPVKMSVVELIETGKSISDIEYVDNIDPDSENVQVPFELVLTKNGKEFKNIHLASIKSQNENANSFTIEGNTDVDITIGQIANQKVTDKIKKLEGKTASMGHKVKMKFEYLG